MTGDDPDFEAARGRGRAAAQKRTTDVFSHPACAGKERAAARLLCDTDLPADKIIAMMPDLGPNPSPFASSSMLQRLAETANPTLSAPPSNGQHL